MKNPKAAWSSGEAEPDILASVLAIFGLFGLFFVLGVMGTAWDWLRTVWPKLAGLCHLSERTLVIGFALCVVGVAVKTLFFSRKQTAAPTVRQPQPQAVVAAATAEANLAERTSAQPPQAGPQATPKRRYPRTKEDLEAYYN